MTFAATIAALVLSSVSVQPGVPHLVLGPDAAPVVIEIQVSDMPVGAQAPEVTVATNVGVVSRIEPAGNGRFRATYTPPTASFPQVAVLVADVKVGAWRQRGWASLPLHGSDVLELNTKKNASVSVSIAGSVFGPHAADARGRVKVPISAPPGERHATVVSKDRVGNITRKRIDLAPPRYSRSLVVPLAPTASWSDPSPAAIDIFVAAPDGTPDSAPDLTLTASAGTVSRAKAVAAGHLRAEFRPPNEIGEGACVLTATLRAPSALPATHRLPLLPGPPARLDLRLAQEALVAGTAAGVEIDVSAFDAHDNPVPTQQVRWRSDFGTVEPASEGRAAVLKAPAAFGDRRSVRVEAELPPVTQAVVLALRAATPASGTLTLERGLIRAGEVSTSAVAEFRDAYGNVASGLQIAAETTRGRVGEIKEVESGRYRIEYHVSAEDGPGSAELSIRPRAGGPELRQAFGVLPAQKPWGVSVGALWSAQSNLGAAMSTGPVLEVAVRPGRGPVEVLLEGSGLRFRQMKLAYADAGANATKVLSLHEWSAAVGARLNIPLSPAVLLHVSARGGWRWAVGRVEVEQSDVPVTGQSIEGSRYFGGAGAGASFRLGPGRVLAEMQVRHAPAVTHLGGNVGGAWVGVGYLIALR